MSDQMAAVQAPRVDAGRRQIRLLPDGFERFALALLLTTPSALNRAWLSGSGSLQEEIAALGLTHDVEDALQTFIADNDHNVALKGVLDITAQIFMALYSGDPCPDRAQSQTIVVALQNA